MRTMQGVNEEFYLDLMERVNDQLLSVDGYPEMQLIQHPGNGYSVNAQFYFFWMHLGIAFLLGNIGRRRFEEELFIDNLSQSLIKLNLIQRFENETHGRRRKRDILDTTRELIVENVNELIDYTLRDTKGLIVFYLNLITYGVPQRSRDYDEKQKKLTSMLAGAMFASINGYERGSESRVYDYEIIGKLYYTLIGPDVFEFLQDRTQGYRSFGSRFGRRYKNINAIVNDVLMQMDKVEFGGDDISKEAIDTIRNTLGFMDVLKNLILSSSNVDEYISGKTIVIDESRISNIAKVMKRVFEYTFEWKGGWRSKKINYNRLINKFKRICNPMATSSRRRTKVAGRSKKIKEIQQTFTPVRTSVVEDRRRPSQKMHDIAFKYRFSVSSDNDQIEALALIAYVIENPPGETEPLSLGFDYNADEAIRMILNEPEEDTHEYASFGMDYAAPGYLGGLGEGYSSPNLMY